MKNNLFNFVFFVFFILILSCENYTEFNSNNKKEEIEITKRNDDDLTIRDDLNGKFSLLIPSSFQLMKKEMLENKYPLSNRPSEVYSNSKGTVNITINQTFSKLELIHLPQVLPVISKQFSSIYPTIKWEKRKISKINERDFIILEFETPASDTKIYNLMAISSLEGKMIMIGFNCPIYLKEKWYKKSYSIIHSIELK